MTIPPDLDARLARIELRVEEMYELLNGGPSVGWDRSIRGRLHTLMSELSARKMQRDATVARWTRGEKLGAGLIAFTTVATNLATLIAMAH